MAETQGQALVRRAARYLGIRESWGPNYGPEVRVIQSSTGAYRLPWCASFLVRICDELGLHLRYRSANARACVVNNGPRVPWGGVMAGDFVYFAIGAGHCGFAIRTEGDYIHTIDGNTSSTVAYRRRHRSTVGAITRPWHLSSPPPKPKPKLPWIEMTTSENGKRKVHWRGPQEKAKRLLPIWIKRRKVFTIRRGAQPKKRGK